MAEAEAEEQALNPLLSGNVVEIHFVDQSIPQEQSYAIMQEASNYGTIVRRVISPEYTTEPHLTFFAWHAINSISIAGIVVATT